MRNLSIRGKSYVVIARDPNGKQVWHSVGAVADWQGRKKELQVLVIDTARAIRKGKSLDGPETFDRVFEDFMARYVAEKKLRTSSDNRRNITVHVLPVWGSRDFASIQRNDVAKLLDGIQDKRGPVIADKILVARVDDLSLVRNTSPRLRLADRSRHAPLRSEGSSS